MKLTRRSVLKASVAAFLSSLPLAAKAQTLAGKKVIVVGAGIAGLGAAHQLQKQGAEVLVLEAGDYVGGRIRTDRSMGEPFEYGAGWIHGPSAKNPIQQLAEEVGADTFPTDDDDLEIYDVDGYALKSDGWDKLERMYEEVEAKLDYHIERSDKRTLLQAIKDYVPEAASDPLGQWMMTSYYEFDIGAGVEDISAANAFADKAFEKADVIFLEGYDTILAPLAEGLDIRLNTPVSDISYDATGVTVDGITADYVVCTVPLGVLKAGAINFSPALPKPIRNAIEHLGFGTVTKIAMKFDEDFWDNDTQYFGAMTDTKGRWNYWLNYHEFSEENILLGLSFGRYAPIADAMTPEEMTEDALEVLRNIWEDEVGTPSEVLTTHWSQDPLFRGAYSYPQHGGSEQQFTAFQTPVQNRVFMAGEHTIFDYHSTTHGALMSGRRAARQIAEV